MEKGALGFCVSPHIVKLVLFLGAQLGLWTDMHMQVSANKGLSRAG